MLAELKYHRRDSTLHGKDFGVTGLNLEIYYPHRFSRKFFNRERVRLSTIHHCMVSGLRLGPYVCNFRQTQETYPKK